MDNNMNCSIIGNGIKVVMEQADTEYRPLQAGAFQNPELSRVQLLTMLRRAERDRAPRRKRQWAAFMASYRAQEPANSNR